MVINKLSGVTLASLLTVFGLGLMAEGALAAKGGKGGGGGQSIGTCSLTDVSLFSGSVGATQCENFSGNDDTRNFEAFGQTWNFLGKDESNTIALDPDGGGEVKSGDWSVQDDLKEYAESLVVVLKASKYYSAYLFDDIEQYSQAVDNGTFSVAGVTEGGKAALSHISVYYAPRQSPPEKTPTVPEPAAAVGLLAVAGVGSRLKRSQSA